MNLRKKCCFTGHRVFKESAGDIKESLKCLILEAIDEGYDYFISGGAMGFDLIAAEVILELKKEGMKLKLEIAIPCLNQDLKYSPIQKMKYKYICDNADFLHINDKMYDSGCMQRRNIYMVDNSTLILAYFNGRPSGTKNTIDYAKKKNKDIWYVKKASSL